MPPRPSGIPRPPRTPSNGQLVGPSTGLPVVPSDGPAAVPSNGVAAPDVDEQLSAARRALATKDAEVRALLAQRDAGIAEIKQLRTDLSVRDHQIDLRKARIKDLERVAEEQSAKCTALEAELLTWRERGVERADDLKLVRGIGPAFERELKALGVQTFAQIAAWTAGDIEQIAPKIKAKPERIKRDDWVKSAADLVAKRTR